MYEKPKRIKLWLNIAIVITVLVLCFLYLNINPWQLVTVVPSFIYYITANFFPPSFGNIQVYARTALYTVAFAIVGTYVSALLSFIFGILMAEGITPYPIVRIVTRFLMTFLRTIPVIIWASIMVFIFGIGSMVGLIALILSTTGFLSRSYAESINEIAAKKLEPLRASGVRTPQLIVHGLLPEFAPAWINWTLFTFEINIRASAILGMVGAGGMGVLIQRHLNLRSFYEVATLILILIAVVLCAEFLSGAIRKRLFS